MKEKQIKLLEDICSIFSFIAFCIFLIVGILTLILGRCNASEFVMGILFGIECGSVIILISSLIVPIIFKKKIIKNAEPEPKTFAETLFEENKEVATKLKDPAEYDSLLSEYNTAIEAIKKDIKEKISKAIKKHPENIEVNCETLPIADGELKLFGYQDREDISLDIRDILEKYLVKELGFNKYQKDSYKTNCFVHYSRDVRSINLSESGEIYEVTIYDWRPKSVKNK